MLITWCGTASVIIATKTTSLAFDPYLKDLPKGREDKEVFDRRKRLFEEQKNLLITHGHFDHLASVTPVYSRLDCKVFLTKTPYKTLCKQGFPQGKLNEIKCGDVLNFGDIVVRALQGKHVRFIKKDVAKSVFKNRMKYLFRAARLGIDFFRYPENDEILIYEICAEGKRVLLMGSADLDDKVDYRVGADLLILPHQGRRDIDAHNERIVDRLKPKKILIDHYDDAFPPFSDNVPVDEFCARISKRIPTQKLIEFETIEI